MFFKPRTLHSGIHSDLFNKYVHFLYKRSNLSVSNSAISFVDDVKVNKKGEVIYIVSSGYRGRSLTVNQITKNFQTVVHNLRTLKGPWIDRYNCSKEIKDDSIIIKPLLASYPFKDRPKEWMVTSETELKELEKILKMSLQMKK